MTVYFAQRDDKIIKLGYSMYPTVEGVKSYLRNGHEKKHGRMTLLGIKEGTNVDEAKLHHRFWPHLREGREWFFPAFEILTYIHEYTSLTGEFKITQKSLVKRDPTMYNIYDFVVLKTTTSGTGYEHAYRVGDSRPRCGYLVLHATPSDKLWMNLFEAAEQEAELAEEYKKRSEELYPDNVWDQVEYQMQRPRIPGNHCCPSCFRSIRKLRREGRLLFNPPDVKNTTPDVPSAIAEHKLSWMPKRIS